MKTKRHGIVAICIVLWLFYLILFFYTEVKKPPLEYMPRIGMEKILSVDIGDSAEEVEATLGPPHTRSWGYLSSVLGNPPPGERFNYWFYTVTDQGSHHVVIVEFVGGTVVSIYSSEDPEDPRFKRTEEQ